MDVQTLVNVLGADFFTGVPDSQLKALCNYLMDIYGVDRKHHIIAANEGNAVALAAGYYLATGKPAVVYMQNSGEGNVINPVASLLHEKVYGIPVIFVIGWRGEPGIHDEPQHIYQGEITLKLLEDLEIEYYIVDTGTGQEQLTNVMEKFRDKLDSGKSVAFVVRKGGITYDGKVSYGNSYTMTREEAIKCVALASGEDPIISTTGKASRELFEIREGNGQGHHNDFLTVGSMGHASSIALGIAVNKPDKRVWCIDGDGAVLMHMGAMAVIGSTKPDNFIHVVMNNESHETVGGMPTVAENINLPAVAEACGYEKILSVENCEDLEKALEEIKTCKKLTFLEIKCAVGARSDLGRPTTSTWENRDGFMEFLRENG